MPTLLFLVTESSNHITIMMWDHRGLEGVARFVHLLHAMLIVAIVLNCVFIQGYSKLLSGF
jgi:hypothetical protein